VCKAGTANSTPVVRKVVQERCVCGEVRQAVYVAGRYSVRKGSCVWYAGSGGGREAGRVEVCAEVCSAEWKVGEAGGACGSVAVCRRRKVCVCM